MDKIFNYTQLAVRLKPDEIEKIDEFYEILTGSSEAPQNHREFFLKIVDNSIENFKKRPSKKEDLDKISELELEITKLKSNLDVYQNDAEIYENEILSLKEKISELSLINENKEEQIKLLKSQASENEDTLKSLIEENKRISENSKLKENQFIINI